MILARVHGGSLWKGMLGNVVLPSLPSSYVTVYSNAAFKSSGEAPTYEFESRCKVVGIKCIS